MQDSAPTKQDLLDFLDSQMLCVISSIGENGYPNSATVAFSSNNDAKLVIGTNIKSRKAANFERNNKIAMTITDAERRWTVQLEGDISLLAEEEFEAKYGEKHYAKLPFSLPFKDIPDQRNYLVVPTHIKLTEANKKPWVVTEF